MPFPSHRQEGYKVAKGGKREDVTNRVEKVFPLAMRDTHTGVNTLGLFPVGIEHRQEEIEEVKELFKDAQI
jgi:hypothetical protein